jgi:hypothetical protein
MRRLAVSKVESLHRVLAGDPVLEELVLRFIEQQYGAASLLYLSEVVAKEILRRPGDFRRAVKRRVQPELVF